MKLLQGESVVAERKCIGEEMTEKPSGGRHYMHLIREVVTLVRSQRKAIAQTQKDSSQRKSCTWKSALPGKVNMQHIKCFKYKVKGYMAKNCPEVSQKSGANLMGSEPIPEVSEEYNDSLFRTVSTSSEIEVDEVPIRGPTFNAEIIVDNVKTRALLDHGAQVSIIHIELLPKVRETQEWAK